MLFGGESQADGGQSEFDVVGIARFYATRGEDRGYLAFVENFFCEEDAGKVCGGASALGMAALLEQRPLELFGGDHVRPRGQTAEADVFEREAA